MILLFLFLLGLVVGSFLNCVIYRSAHELSFVKGRSFCPKCKHQLSWKDNLPLLSFIILKGRCRYCHSPISLQYPLVEFSTGILFVFTYLHHRQNYELGMMNYGGVSLILLVYYLVLVSALIVIFVTDLLYEIIPDEVVYSATVISLPYSLFTIHSSLFTAIGASLFFLSLYLATSGRGMGLGDVKLAFLIGLVLGFPQTIIALYIAFLTGALVGVILVLSKKKKTKDHVPLGPFLSAGTIVSLFWGTQILEWLSAHFF